MTQEELDDLNHKEPTIKIQLTKRELKLIYTALVVQTPWNNSVKNEVDNLLDKIKDSL